MNTARYLFTIIISFIESIFITFLCPTTGRLKAILEGKKDILPLFTFLFVKFLND